MKKKIVLIVSIIAILCIVGLTGCETQATKATRNLEKQADNFNIHRQVVITNCITGDTLYHIVGKLSIEDEGGYLYVIIEYEKEQYKRVYAGLADNVTYLAEDLESVKVSPYYYEINVNPKMWIPPLPKVVD